MSHVLDAGVRVASTSPLLATHTFPKLPAATGAVVGDVKTTASPMRFGLLSAVVTALVAGGSTTGAMFLAVNAVDEMQKLVSPPPPSPRYAHSRKHPHLRDSHSQHSPCVSGVCSPQSAPTAAGSPTPASASSTARRASLSTGKDATNSNPFTHYIQTRDRFSQRAFVSCLHDRLPHLRRLSLRTHPNRHQYAHALEPIPPYAIHKHTRAHASIDGREDAGETSFGDVALVCLLPSVPTDPYAFACVCMCLAAPQAATSPPTFPSTAKSDPDFTSRAAPDASTAALATAAHQRRTVESQQSGALGPRRPRKDGAPQGAVGRRVCSARHHLPRGPTGLPLVRPQPPRALHHRAHALQEYPIRWTYSDGHRH
jgi:hypothetical protein